MASFADLLRQAKNLILGSNDVVNGYNPNILLRGAAAAQDFVQNQVANAPKFHFAEDATSQIQNPILRSVAGLALGVPEGLANTPSMYVRGIARTGTEVGRATQPILNTQGLDQFDPRRLVSGGAELGESLLNVATMGAGQQAAKQIGKETFKDLLKKSILEGAKYGGAYGGLEGLQAGETTPTLSQQLISGGKGVLQGAATGAVVTPIVAGGLHLAGKGLEAYKTMTPEERQAGFIKADEFVPPYQRGDIAKLNKQIDTAIGWNGGGENWKRDFHTREKIIDETIGHMRDLGANAEADKLQKLVDQTDIAKEAKANPQVPTKNFPSFVNPNEFIPGKASQEPTKPTSTVVPDTTPIDPVTKKRMDALFLSKDRLINDLGYPEKVADTINAKDAQDLIDRGVRYQPTPSVGDILKKRKLPFGPPEDGPYRPQAVSPEYTGQDKNTALLNAIQHEEPNLGEPQNLVQKLQKNVNDLFAPIKNTSPEFQQAFTDWVNKRGLGKVRANETAMQYKDIPENLGWDVITAVQGTNKNITPEIAPYVNRLKTQYDALFKEANNAGLDVGYLKDYMTNLWKESPQEIQQKMKGLGQKFQFASHRDIPSYEYGQNVLGLTPKYSHPSQIIAEYAGNLEKAKANIELFTKLKDQGVVVDASVARREPGFKPLTAPGFPRSESQLGNGRVEVGSYYAPGRIADFINNQFSPKSDTPILGPIGKLSGVVQDVSLSGGLPGTPLNAFSIAQATKEATAGRLLSPLRAMKDTFTPGSAEKFFTEKQPVIREMQAQGIPMQTSLDYTKLFDNTFVKPTLMEKLKGAWNSTFNDPTFQRFMPALQINLYEDVKNGALNSGKNAGEAAQIAADSVKNFYGIINEQSLGRSSLVSDSMKALFFAPKYRESMVNFWGNTLKLLDPRQTLKPENRMNLRFAIGSILTLSTMDALNYKLNGHHMWQNPSGKEDKLLIPVGNTTIGIPFLSSIATVPRALVNMGISAAKGNVSQIAKEVGNLGSKPIQIASQVLGNEDHFGKKIYEPTDTPIQKYGKEAGYVVGQVMQPYVKEGFATAADLLKKPEDRTPLVQRLSQTLELPFRFYKTGSLDKGAFYDEYNAVKAYGDKYSQLLRSNPDQAIQFANDHKDELQRYKELKPYANALSKTKNPDVLQGYNGKSSDSVGQGSGVVTDQTGTPKTINDIIQKKSQQSANMAIIRRIYTVTQDETQRAKLLQQAGITSDQVQSFLTSQLKSASPQDRASYIMGQQKPNLAQLYQSGVLTKPVAEELQRQGYVNDAQALIRNLQLSNPYSQQRVNARAMLKLARRNISIQGSMQKKTLTAVSRSTKALLKSSASVRPKKRKNPFGKTMTTQRTRLPLPTPYKTQRVGRL